MTLRPSTKPTSPKPRRNPAILPSHCAADTLNSDPTTGLAGLRARAAIGHAAAAPPRSVMNSRRLMFAPQAGITPYHAGAALRIAANLSAHWPLRVIADIAAALPSATSGHRAIYSITTQNARSYIRKG